LASKAAPHAISRSAKRFGAAGDPQVSALTKFAASFA
jgi:hypothetical protein